MWSKEAIAEAGLDDFRLFLVQVWDYLGLPEPTPAQLDMAYWLQHGERRIVLEAFRGVGKSWITAAFVLWLLFCDPQHKIMVVSASQKRADDFSIFCKKLIDDMPLLAFLRATPTTVRTSNIAFDVGPATPDQSPSVKSVGITGQLTGSRADTIVADDIEVPKNSFTYIMRERISELVKEFDSVLKPGGRILYLGTPQVEETLYNRMPERGYTIRIWTSEVPKVPAIYLGRLAPYIEKLIAAGNPAGTLVDPRRFTRTELEERLLSYGRSGYALQFMLDTSPADREKHPLKLEDLILQDVDAKMGHIKVVWGRDSKLVLEDLRAGGFDGDFYHEPAWVSEQMTDFTGTVMYIDPSGMGADETSYAIIKNLYGLLFLVDVGGFKDGFAESTLIALAAAAARHGVNEVCMERNYGGGMFGQLFIPILRRVSKAIVDPEHQPWVFGKHKEARILDVMEPVVQTHRLIVDRSVIEKDLKVQEENPKYSFIQQFTRMSRDRGALPHEDRLEAVAGACQFWIDRMDLDQDRALETHKEDLRDQELRDYADHILGGAPRQLTWVANRN